MGGGKLIIWICIRPVLVNVVYSVSAPVSVWPLEWNISVPVNTGVPFRIYHKYIYIYINFILFDVIYLTNVILRLKNLYYLILIIYLLLLILFIYISFPFFFFLLTLLPYMSLFFKIFSFDFFSSTHFLCFSPPHVFFFYFSNFFFFLKPQRHSHTGHWSSSLMGFLMC